jgi:methionine--tRNA ligase beta chain
MVSIDSFLALDLRVGKVLEVEEHAGARKPMYKLIVDLGPEIGRRQVIAGIRASYTKDEIVGKMVVCIANLDAKMIAGLESQGMLLAAGESETEISLLTPDRDAQPGSKVH